MSFGDIVLSEAPIRGPPHNPGQGGWPTIRYFNKETGPEGGSYVKKTGDAMCTELGNQDYMSAYIEEAGKTALCSVETGEGCGEDQKAYIDQMKGESADAIAAELATIEEVLSPVYQASAKMKRKILRQLAAGGGSEGKEEL